MGWVDTAISLALKSPCTILDSIVCADSKFATQAGKLDKTHQQPSGASTNHLEANCIFDDPQNRIIDQ